MEEKRTCASISIAGVASQASACIGARCVGASGAANGARVCASTLVDIYRKKKRARGREGKNSKGEQRARVQGVLE